MLGPTRQASDLRRGGLVGGRRRGRGRASDQPHGRARRRVRLRGSVGHRRALAPAW